MILAGPGRRLRPQRRRSLAAAALLALSLCGAGVHAASTLPRTCEVEEAPDAMRVALALRVAQAVRSELDRQQAPVAIVARAGLDLSLFGLRYSHAGLSLRAHPDGPWTVRQLYFACDEGRPRIFDQGLAAFLLGNDARTRAQLVAIFPGPLDESGAALARAATDSALARQMLGASYSANAYAFADLRQNCNQWVAEMLAAAWGALPAERADLRAQAQAWLRDSGLQPTVFHVAWPPLRLLRGWIPWVHEDDHPDEDLRAWRYRVVMPESIERFVRRVQPQARRLEFCLDAQQRLVVREGWEPMGEACEVEAGDRWIELPPLTPP